MPLPDAAKPLLRPGHVRQRLAPCNDRQSRELRSENRESRGGVDYIVVSFGGSCGELYSRVHNKVWSRLKLYIKSGLPCFAQGLDYRSLITSRCSLLDVPSPMLPL